MAIQALGSKQKERTTMKITIQPTSDLYLKLPGQINQQDCRVSLDCKRGVLYAVADPVVGSVQTTEQAYGHEQAWPIPCLKTDVADELLEKIAPIAKRVVAGYESVWNGHNHVAQFSEDAERAIEEIGALCEDAGEDPEEVESPWDAADWYRPVEDSLAEDLGITASTTDEELSAIAEKEEASAQSEGMRVEGILEHLEGVRDALKKESEEDVE